MKRKHDNQAMTATEDLWLAISKQDVAGIEHALERGADSNNIKSIPSYAVAFNTLRQYDDLGQYLLMASTSRRQYFFLTSTPITPLLFATLIPVNIDIIHLLIAYGAILKTDALHYAIARNAPLDIIHTLIHHGADIEAQMVFNQETPLHIAVKCARVDVIHALLDRGANIEATTTEQKTPLHYAAMWGGFDTIHALLQRGANLEARTNLQKTPLHIAITWENTLDVIKLLIDSGANLDAQDHYHHTPQITARNYAQPEIVAFFKHDLPKLQQQKQIWEAWHWNGETVCQNLLQWPPEEVMRDIVSLAHGDIGHTKQGKPLFFSRTSPFFQTQSEENAQAPSDGHALHVSALRKK